jgi:hypothetical protein
MIHVLIFGGIIVGITGVLGGSLRAFWIVALVGFIFTWQLTPCAQPKRDKRETITDPFESWTKNRSIGPFVLMGIGAVNLLHNFRIFDMFACEIFWRWC